MQFCKRNASMDINSSSRTFGAPLYLRGGNYASPSSRNISLNYAETAIDSALNTLGYVPSLVNYTVACPVQNKENKNTTKTCSDRWLPSCPVSLLQKFQMRHRTWGKWIG